MGLIDFIFSERAYKRAQRLNDFHLAISENNIQRVRQFLIDGMNPNYIFSKVTGERPLHIAAFSAGAEMIDCLIAAGADPLVGRRVTPYSIFSPAGFARIMGRLDNAEHLQRIEDDCRQRIIAAGGKPPIFSTEVTTLCQRLRSHRTTSTKPDQQP